MGKSSNNSSTIAKSVIAVLSIVIAIIFVCVIGRKISNNKVAESTEKYTVDSKILGTEDTVQTGKVIVNYLKEDGTPIVEATTKTGNVGETYDIERQSIAGYMRAGDEPIARAGVYTAQDTVVNFYYKKVEGEVKSNIQREGEDGATENSVNILFNNPKSARDYGVRIITKDENGNVINGGEFAISKDETELRRGKVIDGSFYVGKIAVEKPGKVSYEVDQIKATIGYKKIDVPVDLGVNVTWDNENKKFEITLDDITTDGVTASVNEQDEIVLEVTNPKLKDMYEMEIVNKTPERVVNGGKFKVTKHEAVIKEGTVTDGSLYVGEFDVTGDNTEVYKVEEIEPADGYERVISEDNPGLVTVESTFDEEIGGYKLEVTNNDIPGFSAELGNNGRVTVYVETKEIEKYDLAIKKFVSEIDGVNTAKREPVVTVENGEIKYSQNNDIEQAANEQKVTYTLRVFNESNTKAKGKKIIEHIPAGLVFLPENETNRLFDWKPYKLDRDGDLVAVTDYSEATVVATDYLVDKEIAGFNKEAGELPNYEDVRAVFEIDEDKLPSKTERIIENSVEIEKNDKDPNQDNDKTTERIYVKFFDLSVKKYIKEVKVTNNKGEKVKEIGEDKKGNLVKIDVARSDVASTTIRVTYGLKVTNVGEIPGYATELTDYIPDDFELVYDGTWTRKGSKATSAKLENTILNPGESTVLEITFDWKLTENNVGLKTNEAEITAYENEFNAKDLTDDNKDKESMLVSIKTGSTTILIIAICVAVLAVIAGIIYKVRKKSEKQKA